jgi:hypothetical protein
VLSGHEKLPTPPHSVIPANAGIQFVRLAAMKINPINNLDSGCRRNDGVGPSWNRLQALKDRLTCD